MVRKANPEVRDIMITMFSDTGRIKKRFNVLRSNSWSLTDTGFYSNSSDDFFFCHHHKKLVSVTFLISSYSLLGCLASALISCLAVACPSVGKLHNDNHSKAERHFFIKMYFSSVIDANTD